MWPFVGANPIYIDKNYGGTLIIFDRIFGTFQAETESVRYGLTHNLQTWDPIVANTHHWLYMWRVAARLPWYRKPLVLIKGIHRYCLPVDRCVC